MNETELKKIIKGAVIKSIVNFFEKKLKSKEKVNFQILDLVMPKERRIRSIVGGLEGAMGRTLWEPLAKEIAKKNGFIVIGKTLEAPLNPPSAIANTLQMITESRNDNTGLYDAASSHSALKNVCQPYLKSPINDYRKAKTGFGIDIWLQKDGIDYLFDTKTVQPSLGDYSKYLNQILNWYAYFYAKNPSGHAEARIVFPYNPYNGEDFWKRTKGGGKPLEKNLEGWVEDDFWNFVSGQENTFSLIKESFTEIYDEGTLEKHLDAVFDRHKDDLKVPPTDIY
jgi:hypothetical protein